MGTIKRAVCDCFGRATCTPHSRALSLHCTVRGFLPAAFPPWAGPPLLRRPGSSELPQFHHIDTTLGTDARSTWLCTGQNSRPQGIQQLKPPDAGLQEHAIVPGEKNVFCMLHIHGIGSTLFLFWILWIPYKKNSQTWKRILYCYSTLFPEKLNFNNLYFYRIVWCDVLKSCIRVKIKLVQSIIFWVKLNFNSILQIFNF